MMQTCPKCGRKLLVSQGRRSYTALLWCESALDVYDPTKKEQRCGFNQRVRVDKSVDGSKPPAV